MKNVITFAFALLLASGLQAQNTNVTNVTKKTSYFCVMYENKKGLQINVNL